jgi:hypothetical protein
MATSNHTCPPQPFLYDSTSNLVTTPLIFSDSEAEFCSCTAKALRKHLLPPICHDSCRRLCRHLVCDRLSPHGATCHSLQQTTRTAKVSRRRKPSAIQFWPRNSKDPEDLPPDTLLLDHLLPFHLLSGHLHIHKCVVFLLRGHRTRYILPANVRVHLWHKFGTRALLFRTSDPREERSCNNRIC